MRRRAALALVVSLAVMLCGCEDKQKALAAAVDPSFGVIDPLVERDTKQIREGMPKGAELLGKQLDNDPGADVQGLKRSLEKARAGVHDLAVAKGTFFIFVEPKGTILRSDAEQDLAAGESLTESIPAAKKIFEKDAGLTEVWGYCRGLRGVEKGDDLQWVVGAQVKGADGKLRGAYVTGWSLRKYADYLEKHVRDHLTQTNPNKSKPIPLVYVFLVKGKQAYGGAVTPDVDAKAASDLDLVAKSKDGLYKTSIVIEERDFLVVAKAEPTLGEDMALALLISSF
jgi:hypothetical protein